LVVLETSRPQLRKLIVRFCGSAALFAVHKRTLADCFFCTPGMGKLVHPRLPFERIDGRC
jgi:hypothetical protein